MTLLEKSKVILVKEHCKVVRDNMLHGMEVSQGFVALLNMTEELISILETQNQERQDG